jgi:hypothetical protein
VVTPSSTATVLSDAALAMGGGGGGDVTPPTIPGTPTAAGVTATGATLSWTASADSGGSGLAGYNVYRRQGTMDTLLSQATTNSVTLTGLTPATQYARGYRRRPLPGRLSIEQLGRNEWIYRKSDNHEHRAELDQRLDPRVHLPRRSARDRGLERDLGPGGRQRQRDGDEHVVECESRAECVDGYWFQWIVHRNVQPGADRVHPERQYLHDRLGGP